MSYHTVTPASASNLARRAAQPAKHIRLLGGGGLWLDARPPIDRLLLLADHITADPVADSQDTAAGACSRPEVFEHACVRTGAGGDHGIAKMWNRR
jgi:hypothetical protein